MRTEQIEHGVNVLKRVPYLSRLPRPILEDFAAAMTPRHFEAGQVIYIEGEPAGCVYLLESGWVKATRMTREGREQAMLFLRPVELFGDIAVFSGTPYPGTVTALEAADTWVIPSITLEALTQKHNELAQAFLHKLGTRVLHYIKLVEDLSLRSVEARLANTLLQNAEILEGQLVVPRRDWTTFDEMAIRLGTVRDVLGRALKTLEAEGLLKVEKDKIILCDPSKLAERGTL